MAILPRVDTKNSLEDWLKYIQSLHNRTMDLTLDRTAAVIKRICPGKVPFHLISVAGTNGKGSVATMLESIFRHAGYSTGLYTSPHLVRFNERFCVNGKLITDAELLEEFEEVEAKRGSTPLTFFEFGTAIAIDYFLKKEVEVAVMEVGLGGRKDAVNVLDADLACITSIGTDHKKWLGDTRELIGFEKAGILRKGQIAVCSDPNPPNSICKVADELGIKLHTIGKDFNLELNQGEWVWECTNKGQEMQIRGIPALPVPGSCQIDNTAGVIVAAVLARKFLTLSEEKIRTGLRQTSIRGRLEVVQRKDGGVALLDVAHNVEAVRVLGEYIREHPVSGKNIAVMSVLSEKPIEEIVSSVQHCFDEWHLCSIGDENRGIFVDELCQRVTSVVGNDANLFQHQNVQNAYSSAEKRASKADRIVVFGSFLTVGGIIFEYY